MISPHWIVDVLVLGGGGLILVVCIIWLCQACRKRRPP